MDVLQTVVAQKDELSRQPGQFKTIRPRTFPRPLDCHEMLATCTLVAIARLCNFYPVVLQDGVMTVL
jgi:hypothetical protein